MKLLCSMSLIIILAYLERLLHTYNYCVLPSYFVLTCDGAFYTNSTSIICSVLNNRLLNHCKASHTATTYLHLFINSYSCKKISETTPFHILQQCTNLLCNSLSNNSHLLCNNSRILRRNIDLLSTTVEPCIISQKLVLSSLFEKLRDARDETLVCKKKKSK
jgi:hypothetical protein